MIKLKSLLQEQTALYKIGMRDPNVGTKEGPIAKIQQKLIDAGMMSKIPDTSYGIYGPKTKAAVIQFQEKQFPNNPKEWDGVAGSNTISALNKISSTSNNNFKIDYGTNVPGSSTYVASANRNDIERRMQNINNQSSDSFYGDIEKSDQIKFKLGWKDLVDSTRRINVCDAPELENQCARFVHLVDDKIGSIGNAWLAYPKNISSKTNVFSIMDSLNESDKKLYDNLLKQITSNGGGKQRGLLTQNVKELHEKFVDKYSNNLPKSKLTPGSIVGIFWPPSSFHETALYESAQEKRYAPFNTHVGIVIAVKDGVPIILHEFGGAGMAEPYDNLSSSAEIVWIKQDNNSSKWQIRADNVLNKFTRGIETSFANLTDMIPKVKNPF
jgi:peptidoglycan hydrolase-like protein with peptidoglycan-binding domain